MSYTKISKPIGGSYAKISKPIGGSYTKIPKPIGGSSGSISVGMATGVLIPLTYATSHITATSLYIKITKPT